MIKIKVSSILMVLIVLAFILPIGFFVTNCGGGGGGGGVGNPTLNYGGGGGGGGVGNPTPTPTVTPTTTPKYAYVNTWFDTLSGNNPKRPRVFAIDTTTFNIVSGTDIGIELNSFRSPENSLALSPDNKYLYAVDFNSISVIDIQSSTIRNIVEFEGMIPPMAISQDGNKIYIAHRTLGENITYDILVFNTSNCTITDTISLDQSLMSIGSISVIPNSPYVYISRISISGISGSISILDTRSNTIIGDIQVGSEPYDIAITPDGRYAYVVNSGYDGKSSSSLERDAPVPGNILVIDVLTHTPVTITNLNRLFNGVAIVKNSSGAVYAYVTGKDIETFKNVIDIINITDKALVNTIPMEQFSFISCLASTPDGAYIYIGGRTQANTNIIGIISTSTNSLVNTIPISSNPLDIVIQK